MTETPLHGIIREEIARRGATLPFRDFMALALYHPAHGYYSSGRAAIGRGGDFFTSVSVGALFGQLLAGQFCEMWERLGQPRVFTLVEQGANRADFARDVLSWVKANAPAFARALRYTIVEPFPLLRERQRETLAELAPGVEWRASVAELEPFCGAHFSNELLDALPVHLVRFVENEWRERCVTADFQWSDEQIQTGALVARVKSLPLPPIENYTTEISLDALEWMETLAAKLERGWMLAIDYGYPRDVFYHPGRAAGTLACAAAHRRRPDPLETPGAQDITAHVDFTSLAERAEARGLRLAGFTDQHHFLTALAQDFFAARPPDAKESRALQTLIHPQFLGSVFKILALEKNLPPAPTPTTPLSSSPPLRGLRYARDARLALKTRPPTL